ncbi:DUF1840 domain-containing protein [Limnohabitans sp.]|jgi:hypothetical protein|uniref:DUF1840 domain-containing protein n=1 Tax=Limnohabitans sp. TaxID=1907725 RepID=UPI0039BCB114|nr:DUF1840 domain-containing protein [Comamonadaceae bacterium]
MLFKFKSKVTSDLIMLEPDGRRLLKIMLGDDPIKGIVLSHDMPQVLAKLESAVAQDEALWAQRSQNSKNGKNEGVLDDTPSELGLDAVRLAQRASPMIKLLKQCVATPADLVWGV